MKSPVAFRIAGLCMQKKAIERELAELLRGEIQRRHGADASERLIRRAISELLNE